MKTSRMLLTSLLAAMLMGSSCDIKALGRIDYASVSPNGIFVEFYPKPTHERDDDGVEFDFVTVSSVVGSFASLVSFF